MIKFKFPFQRGKDEGPLEIGTYCTDLPIREDVGYGTSSQRRTSPERKTGFRLGKRQQEGTVKYL